MKKLGMQVMVLVVMLSVCGSAFAMGSQGTYSQLGNCYRSADASCSQYGDVWNPNDKGWTVNGTFIPNPAYNPAKPSIDRAGLAACQAPLYEACRTKYPR